MAIAVGGSYTLGEVQTLIAMENGVIRKVLLTGVVCLASVGVGGLGAATASASAGVYPPDTTVPQSTPPVPVTDPISDPPPVIEVDVTDVTAVKSHLPTTGSDVGGALQLGAGALVVGMTSMMAVRRRRPTTA